MANSNKKKSVPMPEIAELIETRLAQRIALNEEREMIYRMKRKGLLKSSAAQKALAEVEGKMKALLHYAPLEELADARKWLQEIPLFQGLDTAQLQKLADAAQERVLAPGEYLFHEKDSGDALFLLVRGVVNISQTQQGESTLLDVLGGGSLFGEMAFLTGEPRTASVQAVTAVSLLQWSRAALSEVRAHFPRQMEAIWQAYARHLFDNLGRQRSELSHLEHLQRMAWFDLAEEQVLAEAESLSLTGLAYVLLYHGAVHMGEAVLNAPQLFVPTGTGLSAGASGARLMTFPSWP